MKGCRDLRGGTKYHGNSPLHTYGYISSEVVEMGCVVNRQLSLRYNNDCCTDASSRRSVGVAVDTGHDVQSATG